VRLHISLEKSFQTLQCGRTLLSAEVDQRDISAHRHQSLQCGRTLLSAEVRISAGGFRTHGNSFNVAALC
jgi:hypothetical protein